MKKQFYAFLCGCLFVGVSPLASAQTYYTVGHDAQPAELLAGATPSSSICPGTSVSLQATATDGTSPYTYAWSPATGLSSTNSDTTTATPSSTQTYTATIVDGRNCTATSNVTITVLNCMGVDQIKEVQTFSLYPNPTEGDLNLSLVFNQKASSVLVEIYNSLGSIMLTKRYQNVQTELKDQFNLNGLAAGTYFMKITLGKSSLTNSFIIK